LLSIQPHQSHHHQHSHHHQGGHDHDHAGHTCGTPSLPRERQLEIMAEIRAYGERKKRRLERARRHGRKLVGGGPYTVQVRFVDIKAAASDADVPQADIDFSLALLNTHFAPTDFTFTFLETVHVVNASASFCPVTAATTHGDIGATYRQGSTTVMNVFLCDMNASGQNSAAGVTYLPYDIPINLRFDGIFLDPLVLGDTGQIQNILSHEAGHWLGLQHTFENGCEFPGDWIDDTPYHTLLLNTDITTCNDDISTCGMSEPLPAPIDNIMGYVVDCGNRFTPQQIDFMCNVYERYRLRGAETDEFCFLDVTIQWNANPSNIKIYIENNGIFYLTYDGSGTNPVYAPNQLLTEEEDLYYGPGVSFC
jgi:Pregnancy-associated plasma protein-A